MANSYHLILEEGLRTPIFDTEIVSDEEFGFLEGWQIGLVKMQNHHSQGQSWKEYRNHLKIWRATKEQDTATERRELWYEINAENGEVSSYTEGQRDDKFIEMSRQAGEHALSLMGRAIELLEK